ncbi:polyprenyl synthetase family protein [Anaeromicropila populeti]|uniref:Farnesyl diphosphate synthase n=1 Tax=Anaeromicropila populeti TaxID=37658 RepID=A0A1I6IL74_9FIRM|nr:farnesyl diphosphate synthase [Anaeromicropila populeti]SFR67485.1 geranylgeranyl diphosphate synthase, type II [Anaeromicropila populeti]
MNFREELSNRTEYIEKVIKKYLPEEKGQQKTIFQAMNYSLQAGGKRLRPILVLETYRLLGGTELKRIEPFLAAIEMIHTYSLVHDDLPAMDDDDFRRGKKTTHTVFGEAMGILAGDALLNYAFEVLLHAFDQVDFKNMDYVQRMAKAIGIIAGKSGVYGMLGGQAVDVENTNKPLSREQIDFIYQLKTGALIEAAMKVGAVLAGGTAETIGLIEEAAGKIGLAFQIQDDILDITSVQEVIGKPIGSDERNHKTTYVTLTGVKHAREKVGQLSKEAISDLKSLPYSNQFLIDLIEELITREK